MSQGRPSAFGDPDGHTLDQLSGFYTEVEQAAEAIAEIARHGFASEVEHCSASGLIEVELSTRPRPTPTSSNTSARRSARSWRRHADAAAHRRPRRYSTSTPSARWNTSPPVSSAADQAQLLEVAEHLVHERAEFFSTIIFPQVRVIFLTIETYFFPVMCPFAKHGGA